MAGIERWLVSQSGIHTVHKVWARGQIAYVQYIQTVPVRPMLRFKIFIGTFRLRVRGSVPLSGRKSSGYFSRSVLLSILNESDGRRECKSQCGGLADLSFHLE
jgi:hypothetical protein